MYSPANHSIDEFYRHQELLLPQRKLGISPIICDVIDIRQALAHSLPFYLLQDEKLPFDDKSFESSYIQYVLHHLQTSAKIVRLLAEALRLFDQQVNGKIYAQLCSRHRS
jgi:Methyltransferase domain